MQYYERLFSVTKNIDVAPQAQVMLGKLAKTVDMYLNTSSRRWIDLKSIFSFAA